MSESQVDGNPTAFFFGQAVRIGSGERLYERGFPVIYMTGGADDDVSHGTSFIVAFPTAHISAVSDAARPAVKTKMTKPFQSKECAEA